MREEKQQETRTHRGEAARLALLRFAHRFGLTVRRNGPFYIIEANGARFGPAKPAAILMILQTLFVEREETVS